jgi:hypothetical protein
VRSEVSHHVVERPAQVLAYASGQLTFQLPANLPTGPVIVRTVIGVEALPLAVLAIATPPPTIMGAMSAGGGAISALAPIRPGDIVSMLVSNLLESGQAAESARIRILSPVGSSVIEHAVQSVIPFAGQPGAGIVQVLLSSQSAGVTSLPLIVSADDRVSALYFLPYRP